MDYQEWLLRYLNPNEWGVHGNNEMGWFIDNRTHWCKTEINPETGEKYNSGWNTYYLLKDGTVHENLRSNENYFNTKEEAQEHLKSISRNVDTVRNGLQMKTMDMVLFAKIVSRNKKTLFLK